MSNHGSPMHFNDLQDNFFMDANFKVDINQKMTVPNKISFNDTIHKMPSPWGDEQEALSMHVPERILVVGQDQHIGTRAPPHEIVYENSILPTDLAQNEGRVATPPRSLTLDKYPFPGIDDFPENEPDEDRKPTIGKSNHKYNRNDSLLDTSISNRDAPGNEVLSTAEEIVHLRRQMARLNRRVISLELENMNRLQKEKILCGLGMAYFLFKAVIWFSRNNHY